MKVELILVKKPFKKLSNFRLVVSDISITALMIGNRKTKRIYRINLKDQKLALIPMSHCLISGNHIVGTELKYETDIDDRNDSEESKYQGYINMILIVFDSNTFLSYEDQLKKIRDDYTRDIETYHLKIDRMQGDADEKIKLATKPYLAIIDDLNTKLTEMSKVHYVEVIKMRDNLRQILMDAMSLERREMGISDQAMSQEMSKYDNKSK